jgi:hypothetical protein
MMLKEFFTSRPDVLRRGSTLALLVASALFASVIFPALAPREPVEMESCAWQSLGETVVDGAEMVDLWLPARVDALADELSRTPDCQSFEGLRKFLTERKLERIWYAAIVRWKCIGSRYEDVTYIRRPFDDPGSSLEFRDLLISGTVDQGHGMLAGLSPREVHMVDAAQASRPPIDVIFDTLDSEISRDRP